uniref:Uncharacterized protein n=1 Tax=Arundo donax TaxID=35708 RepID=A0A0A9FTC6_ARUDO
MTWLVMEILRVCFQLRKDCVN